MYIADLKTILCIPVPKISPSVTVTIRGNREKVSQGPQKDIQQDPKGLRQ